MIPFPLSISYCSQNLIIKQTMQKINMKIENLFVFFMCSFTHKFSIFIFISQLTMYHNLHLTFICRSQSFIHSSLIHYHNSTVLPSMQLESVFILRKLCLHCQKIQRYLQNNLVVKIRISILGDSIIYSAIITLHVVLTSILFS